MGLVISLGRMDSLTIGGTVSMEADVAVGFFGLSL